MDENRRNCGNHKTTFPALSRWTLSYNLRSQMAAATRTMFALGLDDQVKTNLSFQMSCHVKLKELRGWSSVVKPEWSHSESHQVVNSILTGVTSYLIDIDNILSNGNHTETVQAITRYRQHVTFHFFNHNQRQWEGQRKTGHLFPP